MNKIEKIEGWVARDDDGTLAIHYEKPRRVCYSENEIVFDGTPWAWENEAVAMNSVNSNRRRNPAFFDFISFKSSLQK